MAVTEQPYPDSGLFTFDLCMGILFELCSVILISTVTHYGFKFIGVYERLNGKHSFKQISGKTAKKDRALVEGQIGSHAVSANCNHASTVDSDTATGSVHLKWRSQKDGIKTDARPYKRPSTNACQIGNLDIMKSGTVPRPGYTHSQQRSYEVTTTARSGWKAAMNSTEMSRVLQRRYKGIVSAYAGGEQCWGYIRCQELFDTIAQDVLLHRDQMWNFSLGEKVSFDVFFNELGLLQATNLWPWLEPGHESRWTARYEHTAPPVSSPELHKQNPIPEHEAQQSSAPADGESSKGEAPRAAQAPEQGREGKAAQAFTPQEPCGSPARKGGEAREGGQAPEGEEAREAAEARSDGQAWLDVAPVPWLEGIAWGKGKAWCKGVGWDERMAWDFWAGAKGWPAGKDAGKGLWWGKGAMWGGKGVWGNRTWQVPGKGQAWY
mmetsp:Transcript_42814/g.132533  ORF Transcript_42814/g.132533 Transcript_42814/m.132533 type:complete len:436 (+) Transcript_42814:87-1394(+)